MDHSGLVFRVRQRNRLDLIDRQPPVTTSTVGGWIGMMRKRPDGIPGSIPGGNGLPPEVSYCLFSVAVAECQKPTKKEGVHCCSLP